MRIGKKTLCVVAIPTIIAACTPGEVESESKETTGDNQVTSAETGADDSDVESAQGAGLRYSCQDSGGETAVVTVAVGQEYFDFEQTKPASYFQQNSPAAINEQFAIKYCADHSAPDGWYTGPVTGWRGANGKFVTRYYEDVSCQVQPSTSPTSRPVASAQNSQTIRYEGCRFEMKMDPIEDEAKTINTDLHPCPVTDPDC